MIVVKTWKTRWNWNLAKIIVFANKLLTSRSLCKISTGQEKVTAPSKSKWKALNLTTSTYFNSWRILVSMLIAKTLRFWNQLRLRLFTAQLASKSRIKLIEELGVVQLMGLSRTGFKKGITTGSPLMQWEPSLESKSNSTERWQKQPSLRSFTSWTQSGVTLCARKLMQSSEDWLLKCRICAAKS